MGETASRSTSDILYQVNSEWVKELNIKKETINKLGEHRIVYLSDLWYREDFKTKEELEKITKSKMNNFDYIKLNSFFTCKTKETKIKREATNWEKIFVTKNSEKGLITQIY